MVSTVKLFLVLSILVTVASTGLAIKCYQCDSQKSSNCSDKFQPDDKFLVDCSTSAKNDSLVPKLNATGCLKLIGNDGAVSRSCFAPDLNSEVDACEALTSLPFFSMKSCDICEKDKCNGSNSMAPITVIALLLLGVAGILS